MRSISAAENEKKPIRKSISTLKIRLIIRPKETRQKYIKVLDQMICRVEKIINSGRTDTKLRLRAMNVLTDLIKTSYEMVRDVEVEQLERQIAKLESQAEQAAGGAEEEEEKAGPTEG